MSMIADFHIAPNGDDRDAGTATQPFATLSRARDAVRAQKASQPNRDYNVAIADGYYLLDDTVVFGPDDGAAAGHTVSYRATNPGAAVFGSGIPVTEWRQAPADLPGVTAQASGKLLVAAVPLGAAHFRALFDGDSRLSCGRGPSFRPNVPDGDADELRDMAYPAGLLPPGAHRENLELRLIPQWPWVMNLLPLESMDHAGQTIRTAVPATYPLRPLRSDWLPEGHAWFENDISFITEPGQWCVDRRRSLIYLWPESPEQLERIRVPSLTELIRVEGVTDYDGPSDAPVSGIAFEGLTLTHADHFPWQAGHTGWGLQHDWEMFDRPTALMRFRGAERCRVTQCRFVNSGGSGLRLDLHAQGIEICDNLFADLGGVGVLCAGYGPGTKDVNSGNTITNNHLCRVGQTLWHASAIFLWQSGHNTVANNLIHNCPYSGIVVSGRIVMDRAGQGECSRTVRWHEIDTCGLSLTDESPWSEREALLHGRCNRIERNEIRHIMEAIGDGNCVYVSGTGRDNVVANNYVHHCASLIMNAAMRCDDDQHETTIERNVIWHTVGEGIIIKGVTYILNNVLADIKDRMPDGQRTHYLRGFVPMVGNVAPGSRIHHNVFYSTVIDQNVWTVRSGGKLIPECCITDENLYFNTEQADWGAEHCAMLAEHGLERASRVADPVFVDPANGDFTLQPASPAHEMGIASIDLSGVGTPPKPYTQAQRTYVDRPFASVVVRPRPEATDK